MAGVTLLDRRSNVWLRGVTRVRDVNVELAKRKWNWAYKISNYPIERWPRIVAEWRPYGLRNPGRPRRRWRDELVAQYGRNWMLTARSNINLWKNGFSLHIAMILNE